jgi:RHS repeat-associated protein
VKKCLPNCSSPTTTTVYLFSGSKVLAEYDNGAAPTAPSREYIYSGAALLAKIDSSGTKYYHQDHLSNRLVTDSTGTTSAQLGHFPFGEAWYNALNDKLLFTSYERDAETGNDFAMARYHINRLGRFSSPDPVAGSIGDPQSLNRYAYVSSNPVNLIDPLGMNVKFPWDDWFGGVCFNLGYNDPYQDNRWVSAGGVLCFRGGGSGSPSGDAGGGSPSSNPGGSAANNGTIDCSKPPSHPMGPDQQIFNAMQKAHNMSPNILDFYNASKTGGAFDVKQGDPSLDPFGNYAWGVACHAYGFNEYSCNAGAGAYQHFVTEPNAKKAGLKVTQPGEGIPFFTYPYGDRRKDADLIRAGYEDYNWWATCSPRGGGGGNAF